jgi:serine/threonine-protein kinase
MSSEALTLEKGQTVDGKYDIVRQLGQGGMGAVYEAVHRGTHRRVALKVIVSAALAKEDGVLARFQREARASGSIDSAHVVQVLDTGIEPATGNPYMVMEYLSGEDLHDLIRRLGPLQPSLALRIVAQACLGLQRAHEAGVVHRDIKSANMYLARRDGGALTLKLLDFGIAKVRADNFAAHEDQHLTRTGSLLGSPLFMSPEQARGVKNIDGRADLWSLGVVLYQALTGTTPNEDKETLGDLIIAICTEDAPPVQDRAPWVSPEISEVVHKALARDPKHRYATAAEMHDALVALSPGGIDLREDMLVELPPSLRANVAVQHVRTILTPLTPAQLLRTPVTFGPESSPLASTTVAPNARVSSPPGSLPAGGAITGDAQLSSPNLSSSAVPRSSKRVLGVMLAVVTLLGAGGAGIVVAKQSKPSGSQQGAAMIPTAVSSPVASAVPEPSSAAPASAAATTALVALEADAGPTSEPKAQPKPGTGTKPKPKPPAAPVATAPPPPTDPAIKRSF